MALALRHRPIVAALGIISATMAALCLSHLVMVGNGRGRAAVVADCTI
jgi:hypothetical protein